MSSQLFNSSPSFGKGTNNTSGSNANAASIIGTDNFRVTTAIGALYSKLPSKLQSQVAYRHFYTDQLDKESSNLSVKFFSLVILYFCSIFKLQGRRMQYKTNESEKSGRDFAKAHRRSRSIFHKLTACYGTILMRYTTNSVLVYEKRGRHLQQEHQKVQSGLHGGHNSLKNPLPQVHRTPAFVYVSDEMVFYEHLFQITVQIVKLAFNGDESLQALAENETNKLFRSNSFLFKDKKREEQVRKAAQQLDKQSDHLMLNNAKELAGLLTPPVEPLVMKYANQQRTPFMNTQFPGGTNHIKYQRPKRDTLGGGGTAKSSKNEAAYTVEVRHADFPSGHRALSQYEAFVRQRKAASVARHRSEAAKREGSASNHQTPARKVADVSSSDAAANTSLKRSAPREKVDKKVSPTPRSGMKDLLNTLDDFDEAHNYDGTPDSLHPNDGVVSEQSSADNITTSITVKNSDKSLVSEHHTSTSRLQGTTRKVIHAQRLMSVNLQPDMIMEPATPTNATLAGNAGAALRSSTNGGDDRFLRILNMPAEKWAVYDLYREIDSIYQSLANGVEVSSFSIPEDILLNYGDDGILVVEEDL